MAAGVVFGPSRPQVVLRHSEVAEFFADVGKLPLKLFAGLEIGRARFDGTRNRSNGFGLRGSRAATVRA